MMMTFTKKTISNLAMAVAALIAWGAFGASVILEHVFGLLPCVYCIKQRFAVLVVAVIASAFLLLRNRNLTLQALYLGLCTVASFGMTAAKNLGSMLSGENLTGGCPLYPFPGILPVHEWLPALFAAKTACQDTGWTFIWLSLPEWASVVFWGIFILATVSVMLHLYARADYLRKLEYD